MPTYNHFYDLPVYQKCRLFRKNISQIVKNNFPKSEEYHLKSQVLDSSRSITANIAEGFGRFPLPGKHPVLQAIKGIFNRNNGSFNYCI
jgi:23S rRNA-intervening sequence protein